MGTVVSVVVERGAKIGGPRCGPRKLIAKDIDD
jgi:hypothetical protein